MLTPERITALPTAEELEAGYYVLIDSPTLGTRKIAVENFKPPEPDYLYKWDFTKSLTDEIEDLTISYIATYTEGVGLQFLTNDRQIINVPINNSDYDWTNKTLEIDVGSTNWKGSNKRGMFSNTEPNYFFEWFYLQNAWYFNIKGTLVYTLNEDSTFFDNSTLKIVFGTNSITVYKNDSMLFTQTGDVVPTKNITLGTGRSNAFYDITFKAVRIYENE